MYIKDYHKELFMQYIRTAGYSPVSIRNIHSDIKSLFIWLNAHNYADPPHMLQSLYEQYLILCNSNPHTTRRKLASVNKFVAWMHQLTPTLADLSVSNVQASHSVPLTHASHTVSGRNLRLIYTIGFAMIVVICITTLLVLVFMPLWDTKKLPETTVGVHTLQTPNYDFVIQNELIFEGASGSSVKPKGSFMFKFFNSDSDNSSIGQSTCSYTSSQSSDNSTTLNIQFGPNCNPYPLAVFNELSQNRGVWYDIYHNAQKLTSTRVRVAPPETANIDSSLPTSANSQQVSSITDSKSLPDIADNSSVLGLETNQNVFSPERSIPLALVEASYDFTDGDLLALYDDQLVRALLSAQVIGVLESNRIIQEGIVYVRVVPDGQTLLQSGDILTTSTTPGAVKKANSVYDTVVGMALEGQTAGSPYIRAYINIR